MFDIAIYALALLGLVALIAIVLVAIAYFILMHRVTRKLQDTVQEMEGVLAAKLEAAKYELERTRPERADCVPPMRIHWEDNADRISVFGRLGRQIDAWLCEQEFSFIGQYVVEEVGGELIRAYLDQDRKLVGLIRLPMDADECYAEFCFDLGDGELGGVSNPPSNTVSLPPDAVGRFHCSSLSKDFELLTEMHSEARELMLSHGAREISTESYAIPELFEKAHAEEMNNRIEAGGISEAEIRSAFLQQGEPASEDDIDLIQRQWQDAIEQHLLDFSSRGLNYHHAGRKVLVVHDGIVSNYLKDRIRITLEELSTDQRQSAEVQETFEELNLLLSSFSPREAVARFRPLLPRAFRYDLVDQIEHPIAADLYVMP